MHRGVHWSVSLNFAANVYMAPRTAIAAAQFRLSLHASVETSIRCDPRALELTALDVIDILIAAGAEITVVGIGDWWGNTASTYLRADSVCVLLDNGADITAWDIPLHRMAESLQLMSHLVESCERTSIIWLLLEAEADVHV